MIDGLFGSKTRVKLLGLFLNNPGHSFYVREIARNIDEQINSVRRELANLTKIGVIKSKPIDNRLYYEVDPGFKFYSQLSQMFSSKQEVVRGSKVDSSSWTQKFSLIKGVKEVVFAGSLVYGSESDLDVIIAGDNISSTKLKSTINALEKESGLSLRYSILGFDDFYYRISIADPFVMSVLESKHINILDKANILNNYKSTELE